MSFMGKVFKTKLVLTSIHSVLGFSKCRENSHTVGRMLWKLFSTSLSPVVVNKQSTEKSQASTRVSKSESTIQSSITDWSC